MLRLITNCNNYQASGLHIIYNNCDLQIMKHCLVKVVDSEYVNIQNL